MDRVWTRTAASGIQDVAVAARLRDSPLVVAGDNGTVWRSTDGGGTFSQLVAKGFRRVAVAPDGSVLWGVGINGSLWWTTNLTTWTRVAAADKLSDGIEDVVVNYDNSIWITTKNGHMWTMSDGKNFVWHSAFVAFKRLSVGPSDRFWGIATDGTLRQKEGTEVGGNWYDTNGAGMEDVSVSVEGDVWLVGSNGTVWMTRDGQGFSQTAGAGFRSVSAGPNGTVWTVGVNGTLWKMTPPVLTPPTPQPVPKPPPVNHPTPPPPPVITVSTRGAGLSSEFLVAGSRFLAGQPVTVRAARIGDGQIVNAYFNTSSHQDGTMQLSIPIPCVAGIQISFSANDHRPDPTDLTGVLWSNTVQAGCP